MPATVDSRLHRKKGDPIDIGRVGQSCVDHVHEERDVVINMGAITAIGDGMPVFMTSTPSEERNEEKGSKENAGFAEKKVMSHKMPQRRRKRRKR